MPCSGWSTCRACFSTSASTRSCQQLQEMRTLREALDLVARWRVQVLVDVLARRFCAVEQKALGQRDQGRGLELVHQHRHALTTGSTLTLANKVVAAELKLKESAERLRRDRR